MPPTIMSRTWLKSRFERGDTPNEKEWYAIFDSFVHKIEDAHMFNYGDLIDDTVTVLDKTWSSYKINDELSAISGSTRKVMVEFTNATSVQIDHNFDTTNIVYKAFYHNGSEPEEFIPARFRLINSNTVIMEMSPATSGFVILVAYP